jgi:hypothetical protein
LLKQIFDGLAGPNDLVDHRVISAVAATGRGQRADDGRKPPSFAPLGIAMIGRDGSQRAGDGAPIAFQKIGRRIDRKASHDLDMWWHM